MSFSIGLLDFLKPAVEKVLNFIPDPKQREEARRELEQQTQQAETNFRSFILEYEGAAKDVSPFLQNYRGSVRPTLTYFLAAVFAYGFVNPGAIDKGTMSMLFNLNLLSLGFWYGERALKGLGLDLSKVLKKG